MNRLSQQSFAKALPKVLVMALASATASCGWLSAARDNPSQTWQELRMKLVEWRESRQSIDPLQSLIRPLPQLSADPKQSELAFEKVNATYYFLVGHRMTNRGKPGQALVAFDQLKKIDSESAEIYYFLAQEYMKKGLMTEGVASARKALEINPKHKETKLFLGHLYATAKKYSEAFELFTEIARDDPDDEDVMLYLALIEIEQKQLNQAHVRIKKFLDSNPDSALAYYYLGRLEQERSRNKEALAAYNKAVDIRPGFVQAGSFLASLQEDMGDREGAIETYSWLANQTDDGEYHKKLGHLLIDTNQLPVALKSLENLERVDGKDLNNKVKIAMIYVELQNYEAAIVKFQEILKEAPDSENVRYYLAAVLEQNKKFNEAAREYARISPSSKLYPDALRRHVFVWARLKNYEKGWKLFDEAMKNHERDGIPLEDLYEIGTNFMDSFDERKHDAMKFLDEGLDKFSSSEKLLYLKGGLLEKQGNLPGAIDVVSSILKGNPNNINALNFIGYSWAEMGVHLEKAEAYVSRALKLKPKDPFITDSLAWVYYKRGRYEQARSLLMEALSSRTDEAVIADHLGDVLVKLGRLDEAKKYYEMALKIGPSKEADRKALEQKLARLNGVLNSGCSHSCATFVLDNQRSPASTPSTQ